MNPEVVALERAALAAWPAEELVWHHGWCFRAMRGVTRRANSVWAGPLESASLAAAIDAAETFYAARGLPCLFQVAPGAAPDDLDRTLAARGYVSEAPVSVRGRCSVVNFRSERAPCDAPVLVEGALSPRWFELSASGRFSTVQEVYRGLLERLGDRAAYARVELDGRCVAVGLGVVEGERCGLFAMHTEPAYRRRGLAGRIVEAIASHAHQRGARDLYLQVERDNEAAVALYDQLGFVERYGYHYRRQCDSPSARTKSGMLTS
jgi:N-acetylglutamate synthase